MIRIEHLFVVGVDRVVRVIDDRAAIDDEVLAHDHLRLVVNSVFFSISNIFFGFFLIDDLRSSSKRDEHRRRRRSTPDSERRDNG